MMKTNRLWLQANAMPKPVPAGATGRLIHQAGTPFRISALWLLAAVIGLLPVAIPAQNSDITISGQWWNIRANALVTFHRTSPAPYPVATADPTATDISGDWYGVVERLNWPITLHIYKNQTGQYTAMVEHPSVSTVNGPTKTFTYNPPFLQFALQGPPYANGHFDGQVNLAASAAPIRSSSNVRPGHQDIVIADFEGPDYGDWTATGSAFGLGPVQGTLPRQRPVSGYQGNGLASSFHGGDRATGTLTSPAFTLGRPYINFLIGGGAEPGRVCVNLLVNGQIVRTATGFRTGEHLVPASWDVRSLAGQLAQIQIVDVSLRGWGHIQLDQIVQSDRPTGPIQAAVATPTYAYAGSAGQAAQSWQNPVSYQPQPAPQRQTYAAAPEAEPPSYTPPAPVQNNSFNQTVSAAADPAAAPAPGLADFSHVLDVQLMDKLGESKLFGVMGEKELGQAVQAAPVLAAASDGSSRRLLGVAGVRLVPTLARHYGLPAPAASPYDLKDAQTVAHFKQAGINYLLTISIEDYSDQTLEMRRSKDYHYQTYQAGAVYGRSGYAGAAMATQGGLDPEVWQRQIIRLTVRCQLFDVATGELKKSVNKTFSIPRDFVAVAVGKNDLSTADLFEAAARKVSDWAGVLVDDEVFPIKILAKHNPEVTISRGSEANLQVGQVFEVKVMGEVIKDPDTGKVLGYDIKTVGRVTITELEPQFSHAKILEDNGIVPGATLTHAAY